MQNPHLFGGAHTVLLAELISEHSKQILDMWWKPSLDVAQRRRERPEIILIVIRSSNTTRRLNEALVVGLRCVYNVHMIRHYLLKLRRMRDSRMARRNSN